MRTDQKVESGEDAITPGRVRRMGKPEAEERVLGSSDIKGAEQR